VSSSVLLVCRANLCRSPSAEVMLTRALSASGADVVVSSAGMHVRDDQVAPDDFVELALVRGIDLRAHRPVPFTPQLGESADLILTMTRDLLRTMVVDVPRAWPRSFTMLEFVRRATPIAPRNGEPLAALVARVHATRDRHELLSLDPVDDLADPMVDVAPEGESEANELMFSELERATRRLARLLGQLGG